MNRVIVLILFAFALCEPGLARLRGHGGPVRAVAISHDHVFAVSAGFDGSAIVWGLKTGQALGVARPHEAPATAVAVSRDIIFASGDQNGRVAIWRLGEEPRVVEAHASAVVGVAATGAGGAFLSAARDGSVARIDASGGAAVALTRRFPPLAAICGDRDHVVVADRDGGVHWIAADGETIRKIMVGSPVLSMACDEGLVFVGTADGRLLRVGLRPDLYEIVGMEGPITAVAADEGYLAAAMATGEIVVFDHGRRREVASKRGAAVWGLAFAGRELLAAGHDGFVRRYDVIAGREKDPAEFAQADEPPPALRDHPGAKVFEACRACHSLKAGENRAGPSLGGVIGRRIGAAPGYAYSQAAQAMDLVWSREAIARLFEIGPAAMTPGSKMPEQRVVDPAERQALAEFIEAATAN